MVINLFLASLAANEHRLVLDHDFDGNAHRTKRLIRNWTLLLAFRDCAVFRGQLVERALVFGLRTAAGRRRCVVAPNGGDKNDRDWSNQSAQHNRTPFETADRDIL